ncbi:MULTISPECIES: TetR/AcrR family transcriptional regulator [unclassified Streptomyces]|uniref:TetR/AcrR family transcriptional regulator n=1 Tax=unclassified Streptomyces TaxID=2593676 RepID=UPI0037FAFE8B
MSTRARILEVAADLLAKSPNGDISTRAVCDAAQVGAPALYRQFGDKEGLLSAVVDHEFDAYPAAGRSREPGDDPVQDLRDSWDSHVGFARAHPNPYRLTHSPVMRKPPASTLAFHQILVRDLERAAARGQLRVSPELAAQMVLSANIGVALTLAARPAASTDPELSRRVRDAVHGSVFTPEAMRADPPEKGEESADNGSDTATTNPDGGTPVAAARLRALLRRTPSSSLTAVEAALLAEWLERVANDPAGDASPAVHHTLP